MPKFPEPPSVDALRVITPAVKTLSAGTCLARIYYTTGAYPAAWNEFRFTGPVDARWDHHEETAGDESPASSVSRGILYAALHIDTCVAEVFQRTRRIDRARNAPWLAVFALARPLQLLDLSEVFPTRVGASMAINSGSHARARRWAREFYLAYADLHGLYYGSSMHANAPAVAMNERSAKLGALPEYPLFNRALIDDGMSHVLKHCARRLGYALI